MRDDKMLTITLTEFELEMLLIASRHELEHNFLRKDEYSEMRSMLWRKLNFKLVQAKESLFTMTESEDQ